MKKRILASVLTVGVLASMFSATAFAGSASTNSGDYRLYVECSRSSSSHRISGLNGASYPIGSATVRYTLNGQSRSAYPSGSSSKSYWQAGYSTTGSIFEAITSGYGSTVTAYP